MPNTKLTKEKWANHWQYHKFIYILIILLVVLCGDLLFQVTAYRAPSERKVDFQLVADYADAEFFDTYSEKAIADGQAYDETLEEVSFYSLSYSGGADDTYGVQKYMVMVGANEGHVYFLSYDLMKQLVEQGGVLPLNDYIGEGLLKPAEWMDLSETTFHVTEDESLSELGERIYALPLGQLYGVMEDDVHYDIRDKYAVIMAYVKNPETTAVVLQSVIDQMTAPEPAWLSGVSEGDEESNEVG